ncbi:hypothetical protein U1Q18_009883 [Sarracenia purpurea var. burkii]
MFDKNPKPISPNKQGDADLLRSSGVGNPEPVEMSDHDVVNFGDVLNTDCLDGDSEKKVGDYVKVSAHAHNVFAALPQPCSEAYGFAAKSSKGRSPLNKEALEAVVEWLAWYRDSPPPVEKSKSSDGVFGTRDLLTNDEGKEDKQAVPVAGASLKLANDGSDSAILEISVSKAVGDGNVVVGDEEEAVVTELDPASMVGDEVICSRSAPIFFDGKKLCDVACPAKNVLIDENICPVSSISRRMRNVEYKEKQLGVKNGGSSHALQVFDPLSESKPLPATGRKASSPAKFSMKGYLGNEEGVNKAPSDFQYHWRLERETLQAIGEIGFPYGE